MSDEYKVVASFPGIIKKVQTISTGDGAYRLTIDIPENAVEAIMELMKLQAKPQICAVSIGKKETAPPPYIDPDDVPV